MRFGRAGAARIMRRGRRVMPREEQVGQERTSTMPIKRLGISLAVLVIVVAIVLEAVPAMIGSSVPGLTATPLPGTPSPRAEQSR